MSVEESAVIDAAKSVLVAIDSYIAEFGWANMPFRVHCALIVLGERMATLDGTPSEDT
jgi:hypothetical protein